MRKRTHIVVRRLLREDGYVTSRELAAATGLTRRVCLQALDEADEFLAASGLSRTDRVPRRGVRIVAGEREAVASALEGAYGFDDVLDLTRAEDRRFFLLFTFLCAEERVTTELLAERMETSVRTVSSDVSSLRAELAQQNLRIEYDKRLGYRVLGGSFTLRTWFVNEFQRVCPVESTRDVAFVLRGLYQLAGCLPPFALSGMGELFRALEDVLPAHYELGVCRTMLLHLVMLAAERPSSRTCGFTDADRAYLARSVGFELARFLRMRAEATLRARIREDEDYYLAVLLQSMPATSAEADRQNYPFELEVLAQKLILAVGEAYGYDFRGDKELFRIIVGHLIPLVYRLQFNAQIENPLLDDIVSKYARLHEAVRSALGELERFCDASVSDDECALFTLYFASSIEKLANARSTTARVVIVCNAGNAVSRLLQYKLVNAFNVSVVACVAEGELAGVLGRERASGRVVDLVVGVVDVRADALGDVPFLRVTPLLSDDDYERMGSRLGKRVFAEGGADEEPGRQLLELLGPECFCVRDRAQSMDELIGMGGELLLRAGLCDEEYPRQMVSAAHCFGPLTTILIAPGIIMPHAGISEHVLHTGFSFVRLCEPVTVNGRDVWCALSLCTRNKLVNQRAIQQVGMLLRTDEFMSRIGEADTYEAFARLVTECLEKAEGK